MTKDNIQFYGAIEKFDAAADGSLMVSGIASTEAVDADGEIVTADAMRKALPSYLQCGTVREMHQPIAAGNPIAAHVDDDGRTHFTAHIVDKGTVAKIQAKVLKGFSIGAKCIRKVGNKIEEILLKDISVVDLPNNPESFFTVIKFDKTESKKKCKDCDKMECECDEKKKEKEKFMSAELLTKVDALTKTVESLAKTVETLSKQTPPDLKKFEDAIGDLQKKATESQAAALAAERKNIIQKMDSEGRVAFNESGVAINREDLEKMDLPMLKFAARNAAVVPTFAKAIYKGGGAPNSHLTKMDSTGKTVPLTGTELVEKSWEADYGDLEKMLAAPIGQSN